MKVDHAWNGNEINSQADGSHQKISLPNQPIDITGALPTGISAIIYAIGGSIFAWNGGKRPISGVSGRGTIGITAAFQTIFTVPAECVGWVSIQTSPGGIGAPFTKTYHFFTSTSSTPTELFDAAYTVAGSFTVLTVAISGGNVQVARVGGVNYTAEFKYIYWPI